jgi:putative DNA primase/helicase
MNIDPRQIKAKFIIDKSTLETGDNKAFVEFSADKDTALRILNVNIENYEKIKREDTIRYNNIKQNYLDLVRDKKWGDASELLVAYIKNNNFIYTTKDDNKSEIWIYKEGIYVPQGRSEIKEMLRNLLDKWYSTFIYNLVISKIEPDTFIEIDNFFIQNHLNEIPVLNGILDIETRELKEFTPDKVFFSKLPIYYDPNAECPQIDKFLSEVFSNEDDRLIFYELGGFSLLRDYRFEKAFMLVGNGRNGKDKTLELLKRSLGIENCCSVPLSSLVPDSFIISEFFGKMINVAGEINNKDLKDTSMFKALTGRSLISAPRKFLRPVTFQNHAKFVFACNELPMVYDNSKGFWDRWVLLEFPYTFLPQDEIDMAKDKTNLKLRDPNIIDKITTQEELSGLLNKFLEGLERIKKQKDFSYTKGSEYIKNLWIRKSNSFMAFCSDKIEEDYDGVIVKKELRKKYVEYCKIHKVVPKTDFVMKRTLQEMFGASEDKIQNSEMFLGKQEHVWTGVKWKK